MTPTSVNVESGSEICDLPQMVNGNICVWGARGANFGPFPPTSGTNGSFIYTIGDSAGTELKFEWDIPVVGANTFQPDFVGVLSNDYDWECPGCIDGPSCGLSPHCSLLLTVKQKTTSSVDINF